MRPNVPTPSEPSGSERREGSEQPQAGRQTKVPRYDDRPEPRGGPGADPTRRREHEGPAGPDPDSTQRDPHRSGTGRTSPEGVVARRRLEHAAW